MILLLDLDNVIKDASWREGYIAKGWDAYHAQGINDKPIKEIIQLVQALNSAAWTIAAVTGCSDTFRDQIMKWMIYNRVPVDVLLMRKKGDFRPTSEVKLELVKTEFPKISLNQFVLIDDRDDICTAFREIGITALQCYKRIQNETTKPIGTGDDGGEI